MEYRRCTPVVVSSEIPTIFLTMVVHFFGFSSRLSVLEGSGFSFVAAYFASHFAPSWISKAASPPSSTIKFGPKFESGLPFSSYHVKASFVHHQYSSRLSPLHANTALVPAATIALAA